MTAGGLQVSSFLIIRSSVSAINGNDWLTDGRNEWVNEWIWLISTCIIESHRYRNCSCHPALIRSCGSRRSGMVRGLMDISITTHLVGLLYAVICHTELHRNRHAKTQSIFHRIAWYTVHTRRTNGRLFTRPDVGPYVTSPSDGIAQHNVYSVWAHVFERRLRYSAWMSNVYDVP